MKNNHEVIMKNTAMIKLSKIWNFQYKFTEVLRIFAEKVTKELEVIKLAFSKFL